MKISFSVSGVPQPAGSKRAFALKKGGQYTGRVVVMDDNPKSRDWKTDVRLAAQGIYRGEPMACAIKLAVVFHLPRPKFHYGSGANAYKVKQSAPLYPTKKPDATKLLRGLEDALTGIIWRDDAQIVVQRVEKIYAAIPGAVVEIDPMEMASDENGTLNL